MRDAVLTSVLLMSYVPDCEGTPSTAGSEAGVVEVELPSGKVCRLLGEGRDSCRGGFTEPVTADVGLKNGCCFSSSF